MRSSTRTFQRLGSLGKLGVMRRLFKETSMSAILELVTEGLPSRQQKTFPRRLASIVSDECASSNLTKALGPEEAAEQKLLLSKASHRHRL
jgi:hypothetical protein